MTPGDGRCSVWSCAIMFVSVGTRATRQVDNASPGHRRRRLRRQRHGRTAARRGPRCGRAGYAGHRPSGERAARRHLRGGQRRRPRGRDRHPARGAHRRDPPLRRAQPRRPVDAGPGALLPRERGGRHRAAGCRAGCGRGPDGVQLHGRGLRRPGDDAAARGRSAAADQRVRRHQAGLRGRDALVCGPRAAVGRPALLQRGGRVGPLRRGPRARDPPHPEPAQGGRDRGAGDPLRR